MSSDDKKPKDGDSAAPDGDAPPGFRPQPKLWDETGEGNRPISAPASADAPSSMALKSFRGPIPGPAKMGPEPPADDLLFDELVEDDTTLPALDAVSVGPPASLDPQTSGPEAATGGSAPDEDVDPGGSPDGYPRRDPFALISLVLGVVAYPASCVCSMNFPIALFAVVFGVVALTRVRAHPELWTGRGLALGGIGAAGVNLVLYVLWTGFWIAATVLLGLASMYLSAGSY